MTPENIFSLKNFYVPKAKIKKNLIKEILKEKNTFFKKDPKALDTNFPFKITYYFHIKTNSPFFYVVFNCIMHQIIRKN